MLQAKNLNEGAVWRCEGALMPGQVKTPDCKMSSVIAAAAVKFLHVPSAF